MSTQPEPATPETEAGRGLLDWAHTTSAFKSGQRDWARAIHRDILAIEAQATAAARAEVARQVRAKLVAWAEDFLGGLSFNEPALKAKGWAEQRAPDLADSILAALLEDAAPRQPEPGENDDDERRRDGGRRACLPVVPR